VTSTGVAEAADRLEAEIRSAAVLADDPLALVLRASVDLGRAMADDRSPGKTWAQAFG
jgi:hypothetical protein